MDETVKWAACHAHCALRTVKLGNLAPTEGILHPTQTTLSEIKAGNSSSNKRKNNKEIIHSGRDCLDLEMESAGTKTKRVKLAE